MSKSSTVTDQPPNIYLVDPIDNSNLDQSNLDPSTLDFAPVTSISPPFDLIFHMRHNPNAFSGDAFLSLYSIPDWIFDCVDRLRSIEDLFDPIPRQSTIIKACVCNGVEEFRNHPTVLEFRSLLHKAKQIPNEHPLVIAEVNGIISQLRVSPNASLAVSTSDEKLSYRVSPDTKSAINDLKELINIQQYKISIYSIMFTLVNQPYITARYRTLLRQSIDGLIHRLYIKNKIGREILKTLNKDMLKEIEKGIP